MTDREKLLAVFDDIGVALASTESDRYGQYLEVQAGHAAFGFEFTPGGEFVRCYE